MPFQRRGPEIDFRLSFIEYGSDVIPQFNEPYVNGHLDIVKTMRSSDYDIREKDPWKEGVRNRIWHRFQLFLVAWVLKV